MRYFQRLFEPGDEAIPEVIQKERPILNLTTHQLLGFSQPVWQALGDRCVFIEMVRHPLYMVRQQELNMIGLLGDVRDFLLNFDYQGNDIPFYIHGWEELFIGSTPMEQTIYTIQKLTERTEKVKDDMRSKYDAKIITIPFEPFVLNPTPWINAMTETIGTEVTDATNKVLIEQNVPRAW